MTQKCLLKMKTYQCSFHICVSSFFAKFFMFIAGRLKVSGKYLNTSFSNKEQVFVN